MLVPVVSLKKKLWGFSIGLYRPAGNKPTDLKKKRIKIKQKRAANQDRTIHIHIQLLFIEIDLLFSLNSWIIGVVRYIVAYIAYTVFVIALNFRVNHLILLLIFCHDCNYKLAYTVELYFF